MADYPGSVVSHPIAASVEMTPRQVFEVETLPVLLPAGTSVYLTDVGGVPVHRMVEAAGRLRQLGFTPIPHLPARRIADLRELEQRLEGYSQQAGVDDVLVIAGAADKPAGPFKSSMDLLDTGLFQSFGIKRIGVAGHPEGSPDISETGLAEALLWKNDFAARTGVEMRLVTQFGFDAAAFIAWAERIAATGNQLPIHMGVAGPAKITTLLKYAALCGVGASLEFLRKRGSALSVLATSYSPEAVVGPLEAYIQTNASGPIAQIHVFPFGGMRKTSEWLSARGSWFPGVANDRMVVGREG